MDAAATIRTPLVQLARMALLTAIAGYAALAVSLLGRRIAGSLEPLQTSLLLSLAVSVPAAILLVRRLWSHSGERGSTDRFVRIAPTASALLLAAAVSLPGTSPLALAALWLAIVAVEATFLSRGLARRRRRSTVATPIQGTYVRRSPWTTQSIVREMTADGEKVTGELLGRFRAGERTIFLHVAFCPPLPSVPQITCRQISGAEAEVKVSQLQTFGVRFDVRLKHDPTSTVETLLGFTANCPAATGPAAESR